MLTFLLVPGLKAKSTSNTVSPLWSALEPDSWLTETIGGSAEGRLLLKYFFSIRGLVTSWSLGRCWLKWGSYEGRLLHLLSAIGLGSGLCCGGEHVSLRRRTGDCARSQGYCACAIQGEGCGIQNMCRVRLFHIDYCAWTIQNWLIHFWVVPGCSILRLFHVEVVHHSDRAHTGGRAAHCYNIKWVLNNNTFIPLIFTDFMFWKQWVYSCISPGTFASLYTEVFKSLLVSKFRWFLAVCCATGYWDGHHNDNDRVRDHQVDFYLDDIFTLINTETGKGRCYIQSFFVGFFSVMNFRILSCPRQLYSSPDSMTERPCWKAQLQSKPTTSPNS